MERACFGLHGPWSVLGEDSDRRHAGLDSSSWRHRKELYEHSKRHQLMDEETVELNAKAVKKENEVVVRGNELQSLENEVSLCLS